MALRKMQLRLHMGSRGCTSALCMKQFAKY
jgi:hypothetical protein